MFSPSNTPLIMGILNATPDSFFAPSRTGVDSTDGEAEIENMIALCPDIIDIGGESTRPGSSYIDKDEEINRVLPVLKAVRKRSDIAVSIDTRKAEVAKVCLEEGADIINDISAMEDDPEMAELISGSGCHIVLMHKKGVPVTMQNDPSYDDTVNEIKGYLESRVDAALKAGISKDKIIIDPGFGFGKTLKDNLILLAELKKVKIEGVRLLAGISRKSMVGGVLNVEVEQRLAGTIVANTFAVLNGADIIRVHDVKEHIHMKSMLHAILAAGEEYGAS